MRDNKDRCDDCGGPIYCGAGPLDGWQLEDGRNVCNDCSIADLRRIFELLKQSPSDSKLRRCGPTLN